MGSRSERDHIPAVLGQGEFVLTPEQVREINAAAFLKAEAQDMATVSDPPLQEVELRCPTGPRKLFAKLRLSGDQPTVTTDNLVEMACQDCRRRLRNEGRDVTLVLHRFDIVGNLIETVAVDRAADTE